MYVVDVRMRYEFDIESSLVRDRTFRSQRLMPAPLRVHGEAASSASPPSFYLSEYARDSELAGNQRCRVSRERKRNGARRAALEGAKILRS